jgi:HK97 family phage prohead protease
MTEEFTFIIGGPLEFSYGEIEVKGQKQYFVTGYISSNDLDLVNDIVTEEAMLDMVEQINTGNVKLDVDHEAWETEQGPNILPIGRIIEAKYEKDNKRLWVKAIINPDSKRFNKIWNNVKNKFLDAFSIAYKPIKTITQIIGEKEVRLLQQIKLLNVALTGNPANPEARITEVMTKSLNKLIEEENKMSEKEVKNEPVEQPIEQPVEENPSVENNENVFAEEIKKLTAKIESDNKSFEESLKSLKESLGERDEEIKSMKEILEKPQFKALSEEAPKEAVVEIQEVAMKTPLQLI